MTDLNLSSYNCVYFRLNFRVFRNSVFVIDFILVRIKYNIKILQFSCMVEHSVIKVFFKDNLVSQLKTQLRSGKLYISSIL